MLFADLFEAQEGESTKKSCNCCTCDQDCASKVTALLALLHDEDYEKEFGPKARKCKHYEHSNEDLRQFKIEEGF